jgi:hypothetical protein
MPFDELGPVEYVVVDVASLETFSVEVPFRAVAGGHRGRFFSHR